MRWVPATWVRGSRWRAGTRSRRWPTASTAPRRESSRWSRRSEHCSPRPRTSCAARSRECAWRSSCTPQTPGQRCARASSATLSSSTTSSTSCCSPAGCRRPRFWRRPDRLTSWPSPPRKERRSAPPLPETRSASTGTGNCSGTWFETCSRTRSVTAPAPRSKQPWPPPGPGCCCGSATADRAFPLASGNESSIRSTAPQRHGRPVMGWGSDLHLVKVIAERHGASAEHRPNAPTGACFEVRFPTAGFASAIVNRAETWPTPGCPRRTPRRVTAAGALPQRKHDRLSAGAVWGKAPPRQLPRPRSTPTPRPGGSRTALRPAPRPTPTR